MTPKQTLLQHLKDMHKRLPKSLDRMTLAQLQKHHRTDHHQYSPNHYHEGQNLGPGARPPGWTTGENAVLKSRRLSPPNRPSAPHTQ